MSHANEALRAQVAHLPQEPGVYLFKDEEGTVLYVGKAIRLRDRVRSYFASDIALTRNPGIERMVLKAVTIDHQTAPSELEALLLEARLIRQLKPRYNIALRDDKSFVVIKIDFSEEFPPISIGREKDLEDALVKAKRARKEGIQINLKVNHIEYYGPFTSANSVRSVLKTIRGIWPFRDCSPTKWRTFEGLGHGCLFASLDLCDAPCAAKISKEEYRKNIEQIRRFLRGERQMLIEQQKLVMETAADEERFEEAARARNRLYALEHFQYIIDTFRDSKVAAKGVYEFNPERDLRVEAYDISNNQGQFAVGSLITAIIRDGLVEPLTTKEDARARFLFEKARYRKFKIQTVVGISDTEMLTEVLSRRFKRAKGKTTHWSLPNLIVIDGGKGQLNVALAARKSAELEDRVAIASVAKGPTRKKVDLYGEFAAFPQINEAAWSNIAELLREEAHRFAISYYRMTHRRALIASGKIT